MIESAKSGRSTCRTCKEKIAKGELRFGLNDPTFGEDSYRWHHMLCAARTCPAELERVLEQWDGWEPGAWTRTDLDREELVQAIEKGRKGTSFPRAELAPSGRSKCLSCGEKIAKGDVRVVVQREVEGIYGQRPGYLHPGCANKFIEGVEDLPREIESNSDLTPEQIATVLEALDPGA